MPTPTTIDRKRILIFIAFAFGISWITGLVIYLRGGLTDSREVIPGSGLSEAFILLATAYMFAPAIAHLLTRLITHEGWADTRMAFQFKTGWPYWLTAWIGTALLLAIGATAFFVLFPQYYDPGLQAVGEMIAEMEAESGQTANLPAITLVVIQFVQALLISPIVNLIPIFGEEFGWRAYLLPKLLPLGERRAYLISGLIWGLWHAPVIAMGYNYGIDHPGAPWAGVLMFIWVCFVLGTFFGWASLRAGSVWPAVIGHAVLNGLAAGAALFVQGEPNTLIGPMAPGVIGSIGFTLAAVLILWRGIPKNAPVETV